MTEAQALYIADGGGFIGTSCTPGGWDPTHQSGGAVLALLGHLLEDVPTLTPMSLSRMTVDLVRPVPIGERISVDQEVLREGKVIQVVESTVRLDDAVLVRARALRVREAELPPGTTPVSTADDAGTLASLPDPADLPSMEIHPGVAAFLVHGAELRRSLEPTEGPACAWVRLRVPVVAGEPVRRTSRSTVVMDCINLLGVTSLPGGTTAINPDVSAHLMRAPVGEWVAMVGDTRFAGEVGHGFSSAILADRDGVFGAASTSQVLQHHANPPAAERPPGS